MSEWQYHAWILELRHTHARMHTFSFVRTFVENTAAIFQRTLSASRMLSIALATGSETRQRWRLGDHTFILLRRNSPHALETTALDAALEGLAGMTAA